LFDKAAALLPPLFLLISGANPAGPASLGQFDGTKIVIDAAKHL
jgi:hypothetical protein